ncbi:MAG: YaeQ family protein [Oligoflexus sp.]|nr:YaeQ family protein [Oligoflexus sp.]
MALKATIFKLDLTVSDITRGYYEDHALTIARHPSETDLRMLVRLAVFALNAHENLAFTKGLSTTDEPDLWQKSLTGEIEHWIDLGQPIDKRIRQSCGKATKVSIYTYQKNTVNMWYETVKETAERFKNLSVVHLALSDENLVARLIDRTMKLNCVIEDDQMQLSNDSDTLTIQMNVVKAADLSKGGW